MKLPLCYYGNPALRKKCLPIEEINDEIRQLADDMIETMQSFNGIGLAASQVGRLHRIFVTQVPVEEKDGEYSDGEIRVFINPEIIEVSEEECIISEGCLSIPKIYLDISRPIKVTLRALDIEGKSFTETFEGLNAHCILHENDHINGVLFIDRVRGKVRKEIEPHLRKIKKKFNIVV